MAKKVIVLGGGVGGLSAAHELMERGFEVELYEMRELAGGKARSIEIEGTGAGGRPPLPGEHGFRFIPGFYKHLPDTMRRIPYQGQKDGVVGNLVQAREYLISTGKINLRFTAAIPESMSEWLTLFKSVFGFGELGIPAHELAFFIGKLTALLTSCFERRTAELEHVSWWEFIEAESKSEAYQVFLAVGMTRTLVALKAQEASTRTVGNIMIQLLLDVFSPFHDLDRLLAGPTSEMWIDPWIAHLSSQGVQVTFGAELKALEFDGSRIVRAQLALRDGTTLPVEGDYFVSALPVERFALLVTPAMKQACPAIARLEELHVAWMNGMQLYLRKDAPVVRGHANYVNTPNALTSISQNQFWRKKMNAYGDGTAQGCLSVDISNWEAPGIVYGKPLKELGQGEQVRDEVVAQLRVALGSEAGLLAADNITYWYLDPDIVFPNDSPTTNLEPLLINTVDSLQYRPEAGPHLGNLFLASDYVRTHSDLACMESANEAARRAVNGILDASRSSAKRCEIWPLSEPLLFAPARALDLAAFKLGLPHLGFPKRRAAAPAPAPEARTARAAPAAPAGHVPAARRLGDLIGGG
jgi:15-cis-phytoene desaturase